MSATPHDDNALPDSRLQLADLTIDLAVARVTRGPEEIPLPRLSWELLRVLVELAPGIVTTETLLSRVWPGLVVNPETVGQRVKLLRSALGDDPRQPRYIEVVRGRGCRLASPVVRLAAAAEPPPLPIAPLPVAAPRVQRRPRLLAVALVVVTTLGVVLYWKLRRESPVNLTGASASAVDRRASAVREEIALQVSQELELRRDAAAAPQLAGQGTRNSDARLEFVQAHKLLAGGRLPDLAAAKQHLLLAIKLDVDYAEAYVELGTILLRQAEFDSGGDRRAALEAARREAGQLFDRAIKIDPRDGHARLQRANLLSFSDPVAAEREYKLGLQMAPQDAAGHAGFAALLYEDPQRHAQVLEELDKARHLDPSEPSYDIAKAGYLYFGQGDVEGAEVLVQKVLDLNANYAPALDRMAALQVAHGRLAQGIHYAENAVKYDPSFEWARRQLASLYLDLGDTRVARAVLNEATSDMPARGLELLIADRQWRAAGELAYAALETDTVLAFDEPLIDLALRRYARLTGEYDDALGALQSLVDLEWSNDEPQFPDRTDMRLYVVGVGDLLLQAGQNVKGRKVLRRLLAQIEDASVKLHRGGHWTHLARAKALALLGEGDSAMQALRDALDDGLLPERYRLHLDLDSAFDKLRDRPDYRDWRAGLSRRVEQQKSELQKLRREGLVPKR